MIKVCLLGDSVAKGVVLDALKGGYRLLKDNFASLCKNALGITVENLGKFGSTILYGEKSVERHSSVIETSDYVLFEFGGNDCDYRWAEIAANPEGTHHPNCSLAEFEQKYTELLCRVQEKGGRPVLLSLPPIDSVRYFHSFSKGLNGEAIREWLKGDLEFIGRWHETYNLVVFQVGARSQVPVIDITTPFLSRKDYRDFLCEDGIHPNESGHRLIAETIQTYIVNRFRSVPDWLRSVGLPQPVLPS